MRTNSPKTRQHTRTPIAAALVALAAFASACGGDKTDASTTGATPAVTAATTAPAADATAATTAQPTQPTQPVRPNTNPVVPADAGTNEQACCCKVDGKPNASVAMSECVKTLKGACVKATECSGLTAAGLGAATGAGADAGAGSPALAPSNEQQCCCKAAGKPTENVGMSECNKARKGACVKATECKK